MIRPLALVGALGLGAPLGLAALLGAADQAAVSLSATVDTETVRVGESFTVRLVVGQERGGDVQFPALIEPSDAFEQVGPVQIRSLDDGREWHAEYTLIAWHADSVAIPPIQVELTGAGGVTRTLEPPVILVESVLPPESAELELRDARPFLRVRGFPWWLLAVLAATAALAWWTWRKRAVATDGPTLPSGPGDVALREFERLRATWLGGRLSGDRFYDDYEATLRRYARATRGWAPSEDLSSLGDRDRGLIGALRHSLLARFARLRTDRQGPLEDIDAGSEFVRSEMPRPEPTDPEDGAGSSEASPASGAEAVASDTVESTEAAQ